MYQLAVARRQFTAIRNGYPEAGCDCRKPAKGKCAIKICLLYAHTSFAVRFVLCSYWTVCPLFRVNVLTLPWAHFRRCRNLSIRKSWRSWSLERRRLEPKWLQVWTELLSTRQNSNTFSVDIADLDLPFFNQDLEGGQYPASLTFPDKVRTFVDAPSTALSWLVVKVNEAREIFKNCDGILIACPEYNFSLSAPLKNTIDWLSRPPNLLEGKVVAAGGISPGPLGCAVALVCTCLRCDPRLCSLTFGRNRNTWELHYQS